jgi:integron integrase
MNAKASIAKAVDVMRRQHKALATERTYVFWLQRFINALFQMPVNLSSEQKIERFLTEMAHKDVSASTQNQAFNAILFFYRDVLRVELKGIDALRATRPQRLRIAPNVQDTFRLIEAVRDSPGYPTNLVVRMLYGCGMRVSEPIALRIKDVNFEESKVMIIGAKGQKDRVVKLPCALIERLREQIEYAKAVARRDRMAKLPVQLPNQLARKYPEMQFHESWAWVFPLRHPCKDPRDGRMVRWHMLPDTVQRAVKLARRQLGIMVTPHSLRHAFATHLLDRGVNMKALQEAMGHSHIETTSGYCHATALSVGSPLDRIAPPAAAAEIIPLPTENVISILQPTLRKPQVRHGERWNRSTGKNFVSQMQSK